MLLMTTTKITTIAKANIRMMTMEKIKDDCSDDAGNKDKDNNYDDDDCGADNNCKDKDDCGDHGYG